MSNQIVFGDGSGKKDSVCLSCYTCRIAFLFSWVQNQKTTSAVVFFFPLFNQTLFGDSSAKKEPAVPKGNSEVAPKGNPNTFFKLGQEGKYRVYQNQYSTNTVALNKHQHREDHDKRRHLSHKFCLTTAGEFKWNGSVHGSRVLTVSTLRLTIIQLEANIPSPFLHPNWASHRYCPDFFYKFYISFYSFLFFGTFHCF